MNNKNFFGYYLDPFLLSISVILIVTGKFYGGPYNVSMDGLQARLIGFLILLFTILDIRNYLWNLADVSNNKVNDIIKYFFKSPLLCCYIVLFLFVIITSVYGYNEFKYIYLILLLLCLIAQINFTDKFI